MIRHKLTKQAGFTVVELMIATVVFSVILIVITSGVIHFTTAYYKGINTSATQTAARNVMNTIAHNLQYGGGNGDAKDILSSGGGGSDKAVCLGSTQIDYNLGGQLGTDTTYGVFVKTRDPAVGCLPVPTAPLGNGDELLGPKMRLTNLSVTQVTSGTSHLYTISAGVAYGDIDLLCAKLIPSGNGSCSSSATTGNSDINWGTQGKSVTCKSGKGSQFCAVSHLSTQVVSRFDEAQ